MVAGGRELIDTLWNVNDIVLIDVILPVRINRYIMECKFVRHMFCLTKGRELIDTLWNVNKSDTVDILFSGVELIDTLWNVNEETVKALVEHFKELIDTLWNVNCSSFFLLFFSKTN